MCDICDICHTRAICATCVRVCDIWCHACDDCAFWLRVTHVTDVMSYLVCVWLMSDRRDKFDVCNKFDTQYPMAIVFRLASWLRWSNLSLMRFASDGWAGAVYPCCDFHARKCRWMRIVVYCGAKGFWCKRRVMQRASGSKGVWSTMFLVTKECGTKSLWCKNCFVQKVCGVNRSCFWAKRVAKTWSTKASDAKAGSCEMEGE